MVRTWPKVTITHGSGATAGVPYLAITFMYAGIPGSVGSPNSELAIA